MKKRLTRSILNQRVGICSTTTDSILSGIRPVASKSELCVTIFLSCCSLLLSLFIFPFVHISVVFFFTTLLAWFLDDQG